MHRFLFVLTVFALAAPSIGCRLCANPYDHCGPTSIAGRHQPCDPCARAGSILAPGAQYVAGEMVPEDQHAPNAAKEVKAVGANHLQQSHVKDVSLIHRIP
ncbi:MAG: hypothetical protein U9N87_12645 [Planctomycetota bacterium]|nr:hypothetical protein [Planctomycetota bacterium]